MPDEGKNAGPEGLEEVLSEAKKKGREAFLQGRETLDAWAQRLAGEVAGLKKKL